MTKTVTLDQGAFLGKKDFTLEDYLKQWEGWAVQFGNLCGTTEEFEKYKNLCKDTKDLAAKNFEEMYEKQQIEWLKKLKEKIVIKTIADNLEDK